MVVSRSLITSGVLRESNKPSFFVKVHIIKTNLVICIFAGEQFVFLNPNIILIMKLNLKQTEIKGDTDEKSTI